MTRPKSRTKHSSAPERTTRRENVRHSGTGEFVTKRDSGRHSGTGEIVTKRGGHGGDVTHASSGRISERISQVREGLPVSELSKLATELVISRDQLASILGITLRTLQRKAEDNERLGTAASDRLARVQRIYELAIHVLGDRDKASRWMTVVSRPLGGELPLQLLDTDVGTQRVEQELYQIKYGMPA
jgi:putative toxin-antitoxin system antitoxin component (TIGR02293 family)